MFSEPRVLPWPCYTSSLGIETPSPTGTTTVEDEPAVVYELAEPGDPDETGIQTTRIVIDSSGMRYGFQIDGRYPEGGGEMRTKYLHVSSEPGDVQVEGPSWLEKTE